MAVRLYTTLEEEPYGMNNIPIGNNYMTIRVVGQKKMVMSPTGPKTNDCAGGGSSNLPDQTTV
jgi:hypothetical protein